MKHKSFELLCVSLSLLLLSCTPMTELAPRTVGVRISVSGPSPTKVTGASYAAESSVATVQVLLFDESGNLVSYGSSNSSSVYLRCTCGMRKVWVFANSPSLSAVSNLSELMSFSFPLETNSPGNLLMSGSVEMMIETDVSRSVQLSRMCAKIVLAQVTKAFSSDVLQEKEFILEKIYATNVVAESSPGGVLPSTSWYNKMGWKAECDELLCDNAGQRIESSLEEEYTYYVYPNDTADDVRGGEWSPRYTRLVMKTTLDGDTGFYVIDIPDVRANCSYVISNVTITRPGSPDEEHKTSGTDLDYSLTVTGWSLFPVYYENL